jgi:hypothetical protein
MMPKCAHVWPVLVLMLFAGSAGFATAQEAHPVFALPPLSELDAIVDRPLFSQDRRPHEAPPTDASTTRNESPSADRKIVLAGTATDQSARAVAILHDVAQGVQFRVWVGDEVQGWTVKAIKPRTLVLGTETQEVTVTLDEPVVPEMR